MEGAADKSGGATLARSSSPERGSGGRLEEKLSYKKSRVLEVPMQVWRKYGFVLLWAAVGLDLMLSVSGCPYLGQTVSAIFVIIYLFDHVSIRRVVTSVWSAIIDLYFREISVGGAHKLECLKDGRGVIFAIAPHVNQFIDPIVVMKVVAEKSRRHVSFLTAAVSYQRKYVGFFARAMKGIPVARPEDYEKPGPGKVVTKGANVEGTDTKFTKTFGKGFVIIVKSKGRKMTGKVAQVIDDTHMTLAGPLRVSAAVGGKNEHSETFKRMLSPQMVAVVFAASCFLFFYGFKTVFPSWSAIIVSGTFHLACLSTSLVYWSLRDSEPPSTTASITAPTPESLLESEAEAAPTESNADAVEPSNYSVQPFVDQKEMFEKCNEGDYQVYASLLEGGTLGIFPEGGTHDGYRLLPLKWGIGTMVLGAMAKHEGPEPCKISVVPVGVNYFNPHKFRSTVSVDFGDPIEFSPDLAMQWKNGNKDEQMKATAAVMELIMSGVSACTLQAKDMTSLETFRTLRRLMVDGRLSVADNVALTQGIAAQLKQRKDDPRVMDVLDRCRTYNSMLQQYHVQDHQVQKLQDKVVSDHSIIMMTLSRIGIVLLFGLLLLPYWIAVAPTGLFLSVYSDLKARQVGKMSVKGTWKILLGPIVYTFFHLESSIAIFFAFGEFPGLVWFFLSPVFATYALFAPLSGVAAAEEGGRVLKSINSLMLLMRQKHIGLQLYEFRQTLYRDVQAIKEDQGWLGSLDASTRERLEARQVMQWEAGQDVSSHQHKD